MSTPIKISVTFDRVSRRKDKSISLAFSSNLEVPTEELAELDRLLQQAGWCLFSPNELKLEDLPRHDAPTEQRKSKGQRLRAVYFLLWRKLQVEEDFDSWFARQFEKIMDQIKDKLDV